MKKKIQFRTNNLPNLPSFHNISDVEPIALSLLIKSTPKAYQQQHFKHYNVSNFPSIFWSFDQKEKF